MRRGCGTAPRFPKAGGRRSAQREDDDAISSWDVENPPADRPCSRYAASQRPPEEAWRSAPPACRAGAASWARRGGNGDSRPAERQILVSGRAVAVRVDIGGTRSIKKK